MDPSISKLDGAFKRLAVEEKTGGADNKKAKADRDRAELKAFYERELARYSTTKRGGAKAFEDDEDDEGIDTSLAAGADGDDDYNSADEQETPEDRAFVASDNEYESSGGDDDESDFDYEQSETESEGGSDFEADGSDDDEDD